MSSLSSFDAELRVSPKPPLIAALIASFVLSIGVEVLSYPARLVDRTIGLFLFLCISTAINWGLSHRIPSLERWLTVSELVLAVNLISIIFTAPVALSLTVIPVTLAVAMINFRAGLIVAGAETLIAIALPVWVLPSADPGALWITLSTLWGVVGVMGMLWHALHELATWMAGYFERGQQFLEQARDRKAELERASENLTSANRQLALANERAVALRTIAEEAQQSKTMFVANVSHEFRTPLNMIIGLVELMAESPDIYDVVLSPKMREDLNVVYRNCEHLSGMINDVLDLTRIESNRLILHRQQVQLETLIKSCIQAVRPLIDKKGLALRVALLESPLTIYCDKVRIRQVLLNLLSNAARFTDQGEITIAVSQDDNQVRVTVTDTGTGIAPEDAERIFEPFWQSPGQMWREKGSGLGLSISKRFVQLHGGEMWLESELGSGTSVSFTLPVSQPIEHIIRPNSRIQRDWIWHEPTFMAGKPKSTRELTKPCIAIYDTTDALYPRFARFANEAEFVNISELDQYLETTQRYPARALVINTATRDELLPLITRAQSQVPDMPVIGCCVPHPATRALQAGAVAYLTKPVTRDDLQHALSLVDEPVNRILVADDDEEFGQLLRRTLLALRSDLEIITTHTGRDTLRELQEAEVDLLLLDVLMPDMNGWDVLKTIARGKKNGKPPIFFVSAQDPIDQPQRSETLIVSMKDGLQLSQLLHCSLEIPKLLMKPEPEPDREPA